MEDKRSGLKVGRVGFEGGPVHASHLTPHTMSLSGVPGQLMLPCRLILVLTDEARALGLIQLTKLWACVIGGWCCLRLRFLDCERWDGAFDAWKGKGLPWL